MKKTLLGVLFFILIALTVELLLSLGHLEKHDHLFLQRSDYPFFIPGTDALADYYITNPHFGYQLNVQHFPRHKKDGVTRIFIVGSSAAYGWPYGEKYGFSGYLRRALDQVAPEKFEIINAAGMSFGSHRVLDELRDLVNYEPDLIIINTGNNEFVEKNILPPDYWQENQLKRISGLLAKTNIYRALRLGIFKTFPKPFQRPVARDITDIRSDIVVRHAGIDRTAATESEILPNYQKNLQGMKKLLSEHNIKGIFSTVPNNVVTWMPMSTPPVFANRQEFIKWSELQDKIYDRLADGASGKKEVYIELERLLNDSLVIYQDYAGNWYNLGQVKMAQKQFAAAYKAFVKARDLDRRTGRALSSFNQSIRDLVKNDSDFELLDLDEAIANVIRNGYTDGIFLDYCHYTIASNKFIAIEMLPVIQKIMALNLPLAQIEKSINDDPASPGNDPRLLAIELYARGMTYHNNQMYEESKNAFIKVLEIYPSNDPVFRSGMMTNLASAYLLLGQKEESKQYYLLALKTDPDNTAALLEVGRIYLDEGKLVESAELFSRLIKRNQYSPDALGGLARVAQLQGKTKESIKYYEESIRIGGGNAQAYKGLAKAFFSLGENQRGGDLLIKAQEYDPFDTEIDKLLSEFKRTRSPSGR